MKKTLGYIISVVGLLGLLLTSDAMRTALSIKIPAEMINTTWLIGSIIILGIGIVILFKGSGGSGKQPSEVPIYHGNKIVGYRRV
jgi:hypothetical protein